MQFFLSLYFRERVGPVLREIGGVRVGEHCPPDDGRGQKGYRRDGGDVPQGRCKDKGVWIARERGYFQ